MGLVVLDLVLIVVGVAWLILRPGLGPVVLLGIYQGFGLVVNIVAICGHQFGSVGHKALTASIALRLFAVVALLDGYWQFRKNQIETIKSQLESTTPAT